MALYKPDFLNIFLSISSFEDRKQEKECRPKSDDRRMRLLIAYKNGPEEVNYAHFLFFVKKCAK
jgi:hypothetical protein